MLEVSEDRTRSVLESISTAMVRLHKEQFGRGPTRSRAFFAGPDGVVCVMRDALLPAERRMVELGQQDRVRDVRMGFQAAAQEEFVTAVEQIVDRKVVAFASGIDPDSNVVFENFLFEPREAAGANGASGLAVPDL